MHLLHPAVFPVFREVLHHHGPRGRKPHSCPDPLSSDAVHRSLDSLDAVPRHAETCRDMPRHAETCQAGFPHGRGIRGTVEDEEEALAESSCRNVLTEEMQKNKVTPKTEDFEENTEAFCC